MLSPWTVTSRAVNARVAGPLRGVPSSSENLLPWQLQLIVPPSTLAIGHPWWGQTARKPWNVPSVGWVTPICEAGNKAPPPTGTSLALPTTAPPPLSVPGDSAWSVGAGSTVVAPLSPASSVPHALRRLTAPTAPAPASNARRLVVTVCSI